MPDERATAKDVAGQACSCALAIASALPEARVAIATGRAEIAGALPLGPGVEKAASLLELAGPGAVRVDPVTVSLLDPRYRVEGGVLRGGDRRSTRVRRLLGRPTECVGRRKELRLLRDTMEDCVVDSCAQAVLLTAPGTAATGTGAPLFRPDKTGGFRSNSTKTVAGPAAEVLGRLGLDRPKQQGWNWGAPVPLDAGDRSRQHPGIRRASGGTSLGHLNL